jgi:hypothetical protein
MHKHDAILPHGDLLIAPGHRDVREATQTETVIRPKHPWDVNYGIDVILL